MISIGSSVSTGQVNLTPQLLGVPAAQLVRFEGANAVLFAHLWHCVDEAERMSRAFDRGRPLQRVYARVRRIMIMLDLAWACQGDDPDKRTLDAIEDLMTWHPSKRKGMRLPIPDETRYQAALNRLGNCELSVDAQLAIARLRGLPEQPVDWQISGNVEEPIRFLHDCNVVLNGFAHCLFDRLIPSDWDWLNIDSEGVFKLMLINGSTVVVARPHDGQWRRYSLWSLIRKNRLARIVDPLTLARLEQRCFCPIEIRVGARAFPSWPISLPEIGTWVCRPTFGHVVNIKYAAPAQPGGDKHPSTTPNEVRIEIRLLEGVSIFLRPTDYQWTTLAGLNKATDLRRLASRVGRFIKAYREAGEAKTEVAEQLRPGYLFPMPANLDRVVAFWIALHLDYLMTRCKMGKAIQPSGFMVFSRATSLGVYEMNSVRCFLLGLLRAEVAARGDVEAVRLVSPMLHLARRSLGGPVFWDAPSGKQLREATILACRGPRQVWVRTSQHTSAPLIAHQWLYRLLAIADNRSLDKLLIAWMFDITDLRYRWTSGSAHRLAQLAEFWHRYAAHRDRPRISRYRQARGQLADLVVRIADSDFALRDAASELGLSVVTIDLLDGKILEAGLDIYRHTQLAALASIIFRRNIVDQLGLAVQSAQLQITSTVNLGAPTRAVKLTLVDGREIEVTR